MHLFRRYQLVSAKNMSFKMNKEDRCN